MSYRKIIGMIVFGSLCIAPLLVKADVVFSDGFETCDLSKSENGVAWTDRTNTSVVTDKAKSGVCSLKFHYAGNTDLTVDSFSEQRFSLGSPYTEIWVQYDLFIPSNYYHRETPSANNNKGLVKLWNGTYPGYQDTGINFWPDGSGDSIPSVNTYTDTSPTPHLYDYRRIPAIIAKPIAEGGDLGSWVLFTMQIRVSDIGGSNGIVRIWKNKSLIYQRTDLPNWHSQYNYFDKGYILGWANSGFDVDTDFYVDNIVISTSGLDLGFQAPNAPSMVNVK